MRATEHIAAESVPLSVPVAGSRAEGRAERRFRGVDTERLLRVALIIGACLWLVCAVLLPVANLLGKSVLDQDGAFVGLANFRAYFGTPALSGSLWNSVRVALTTTVVSVTLGFGYAYGLARTRMPGKAFFRGWPCCRCSPPRCCTASR